MGEKTSDLTKDFFSLQEKKVSTLIIGFVFFSLLAGYSIIFTDLQDIPINLVNVILGLITAIGVVNGVDVWKNGSQNQYSYNDNYGSGNNNDYNDNYHNKYDNSKSSNNSNYPID